MLSTSRPTAVCGAADSAAGCQGWRSQTKGEKRRADWAKLASDQAAQGFHLPRGAGSQGYSQFKTSSFPVYNTGSLFLS